MNGPVNAAFFFVLLIAVLFGPPRESVADVVSADAAWQETGLQEDWVPIRTENAGMLSLPPEWDVILKDDVTERSPDFSSGLTFNVQQSLYARFGTFSADNWGALQVFSMWGVDREGRVRTLPADVLSDSEGPLVAGLLNARYGRVRQVSRNLLNTDLKDISITTWETGFSPAEDTRYGSVALFHGEKLILVLIRYLPRYEEHWQKQFEAIVNRWVTSLILVPGLMPDSPALPPLPEAAVAAAPAGLSASSGQPVIAQDSSSGVIEAAAPALGELNLAAYGLYAGSAALMLCVFFALRRLKFFFNAKSLKAENLNSENPEAENPETKDLQAKDENDPEILTAEPAEGVTEPEGAQEGLLPASAAPEPEKSVDFDETVVQLFDSVSAEDGGEVFLSPLSLHDAPLSGSPLSGSPLSGSPLLPPNDAPPGSADAKDATLPGGEARTLSAEMGFDRVYTLIDQALSTIEASENVMPVTRYYSNMEELPDLSDFPVLDSAEAESADDGGMDLDVDLDLDLDVNLDLEEHPASMAPPPSRPEWLCFCAFVLMAMGDITASLLFVESTGVEHLVPKAWEIPFILFGNSFALLGLSCAGALAVRFLLLRRPLKGRKFPVFPAVLSALAGACLFSLSFLSFFSVLPNVTVMRGCALAVSVYLSYRILTHRRSGAEDLKEPELPKEEAPPEEFVEMKPWISEPVRQNEMDDESRKRRIVENVFQRAGEILEGMKSALGVSYALDTLRYEILGTLSDEGSMQQILQVKETTEGPWPDCFILKLSGRVLLGLVRTGRYHIGRGVLSSEGEDLAGLFRYVSDERLRHGCDTPDEVQKMIDAMRRAVEELG
ncbi:MAG: hypothetical protein LBQ90_04565 [Synergistaceae bacterium]|nr:hypothetical protein [Synergistaceae bacterium]